MNINQTPGNDDLLLIFVCAGIALCLSILAAAAVAPLVVGR